MEVDGSGRTNARRWLRNGATKGKKGRRTEEDKEGKKLKREERKSERRKNQLEEVGEREPSVMRFDPAVGESEFGYLIHEIGKNGAVGSPRGMCDARLCLDLSDRKSVV